MFAGHLHEHDGDCYHMYNPKTKLATETKDIIWLKQICQKQDNLELWCELGVYVSKVENPEMKIENESNKFLEGDKDVDLTLEAWWENESFSNNEIGPYLSNTS